MEANERLQKVQAALTERGVRDVKFFFSESATSKFPTDVKNDAAYLLEQYLEGKTKVVESFNDEVLPV